MITPNDTIKLAILQRVCTGYRRDLFRKLSNADGFHVRVFIGQDVPNDKACSVDDLSGIDIVKHPTRFFPLGKHKLTWQRGLIKELEAFNPDVILCEGDSHVLGYLRAFWYRKWHRNVALVHWSLGGLPGVTAKKSCPREQVRFMLQKHFDSFIVYSSFGCDAMRYLGHPDEKLFVATNVCDTDKHLLAASQLHHSPSQMRKQLDLPEQFTVIYVGVMGSNKKVEILLDVAGNSTGHTCNFVLAGDGPQLQKLRDIVSQRKLDNVFLPGRISDLPLYYRASNVLILPGRGGMVISEAMAHGLPVIVHQGDGTEYDLVIHNQTGLLLDSCDVAAFRQAIQYLAVNPDKACQMGVNGQQLIRQKFSISAMTEAILEAIRYAYSKKHNATH